jgi:hypothetical protein
MGSENSRDTHCDDVQPVAWCAQERRVQVNTHPYSDTSIICWSMADFMRNNDLACPEIGIPWWIVDR